MDLTDERLREIVRGEIVGALEDTKGTHHSLEARLEAIREIVREEIHRALDDKLPTDRWWTYLLQPAARRQRERNCQCG